MIVESIQDLKPRRVERPFRKGAAAHIATGNTFFYDLLSYMSSGLPTDCTESYVRFLLFLLFLGFNHYHLLCHRHVGIYFYHNVCTKIRPPRMTG